MAETSSSETSETAESMLGKLLARSSDSTIFSVLSEVFGALERGFALFDEKLELVLCNDRYGELFLPINGSHPRIGETLESVLKRGFAAFDLPEDMTFDEFLHATYESITSHAADVEYPFKDGRIILGSSKKTKLGGYLVTVIDVTDTKVAENRAMNVLEDAIGALEEGFALWDADQRFLMGNQKFIDMMLPHRETLLPVGVPAKDAMTEHFLSGTLDLPSDVTLEQFLEDTMSWVFSYGDAREFSYKNGRTVVARCNPTEMGGYLITAIDVTKERNADQKARDMLLDAFQSLDEGLVLCDENMNYVFGNDAWKNMLFKGFEHNLPEPGDSIVDNLLRQIGDGYYSIPDGMTNEEYADWAMGEMAHYGKNVHYSSADGRHFTGSSHTTDFGGSLLFIRDVTQQKKVEEELETQRDLAHQNEKLSALGELLAGVAHELNNPLSIVVGYSQMLQGKLGNPKQEEKIDRINQAAERSARIVKTFLAMARQKPSKIERCDIAEIVEVAIDVAGYGLRSTGIEIDFTCPEDLPPVAVDKDQMAQVFSNLIVNAEQAMANVERESKLAISAHYNHPSGEVILRVSDNGKGITETIAKRIFDPFYTTKEVGEGTGFGLAFCHRIVTGHQGRLTVESEPDVGTTFTIRLPAMQSSAPAPKAADDIEVPLGMDQKVLIVDDEIVLADLIAEILRNAGYRPTTINAPEVALDMLQEQEFDAIISDMKMPRMTGEQLMEHVLDKHPQYAGHMGFVTGDSLTENVNEFLGSGQVSFIEKPVIVSELLTLAASLCDNGKDEKWRMK